MILKASVLPKQAQYINSTAPIAMYTGGVGAGKTIADVLLIIKLMVEYPGIDILACAPTYAMLRDTLMREFKKYCPEILLAEFREGIYPEAVFHAIGGKQSTVRFRSFDNPGKPKGITVGAVIADEVTEMPEEILDEILRRLRQKGMPNYFRMSTNPDSKLHYIYRRYVEPWEKGEFTSADIEYIHTTSFENFLLPENFKAELRKLEKLRPGHYMRSVLGEWGDFHEDRIGAFEEVPEFSSMYRVAFVDTSYSDRKATDRTAVSIVDFVPLAGKDNKYWPIEFTGMSWEKSVTHPEVVDGILLFLDQFKPIETCLESQLGDSTKLFIDRFREAEKQLKLGVKNHWTTLHQTRNKHERIMLNVAGNKDRMRVLAGTDAHYLNSVVNYKKGAPHEDEIDSLAGAVELWRTSKALGEFIRRMERK